MKQAGRIWSGGVSNSTGPDLSHLMTKDDIRIDSYLLNYEISGLIAYHLELLRCGVIPNGDSKEILNSLLKLQGANIELSPEFEDVHSFVDAKINEFTGAGKNLRIFLSRNDQSHYDIRSFYMDRLLEIAENLAVNARGIKENLTPTEGYMVGYTHYRQAMPVAFSTYFDYVSSVMIALSKDALSLFHKFAEYCPLGYGSGYGSPLPVDKTTLARSLGFQKAFENPVYGSFYRGSDDMEIAFLETRILTAISRFSQDLITFCSDEFGFLSLPGGFTTGSSLMPNKKNPDFLEMLQGFASESLGILTTSITVLMNKGTGYHREFQLSKDKEVEFTLKTIKILEALKLLYVGLKIDAKRAEEIIENSSNATMEAYSLFKSGLKWKDAYREVGNKLKTGQKLSNYIPEHFFSLRQEEVDGVESEIKALKKQRLDIVAKLREEAGKICRDSASGLQ